MEPYEPAKLRTHAREEKERCTNKSKLRTVRVGRVCERIAYFLTSIEAVASGYASVLQCF